MKKNTAEIQQIESMVEKFKATESLFKSFNQQLSNLCSREKNKAVLEAELTIADEALKRYNQTDTLIEQGVPHDLEGIVAYLKALSLSENVFKKENDEGYLVKCKQFKEELVETGLLKIFKAITSKKPIEKAIRQFKDYVDTDILEDVYFKARKALQMPKIQEYAENFKKSYKMLIVGEKKAFEEVFEKEDFFDFTAKCAKNENSGALANWSPFGSFIYSIFVEIFKRMEYAEVIEAVGSNNPLGKVVKDMASEYYQTKFIEKNKENLIIEI